VILRHFIVAAILVGFVEMAYFKKQTVHYWIFAVVISLFMGLVWQATRLTHELALESLITTGGERLTLYAGTLRGALSRYAYLPYVLAQNEAVRELLDRGVSAERVNRYLEELNREAGSDALYVMAASGTTLASSNWRESFSFVGNNYGFRPYFFDAQQNRQGRFFAIGVTTGLPGLFMSHPVYRQERFVGAAVVKVDLDPLQDDWSRGGETVLVSDNNGVLFLASRDEWKYRTLAPLSEVQRASIHAGRQYVNQPLQLSPLQTIKILGEGRRIVRAEGISYLMLSRPLAGMDWELHHLTPMTLVEERTQAVAIIGIASVLLALVLVMYVRERRQKQLSRRKARDAEAMRELNLRLQEEIDERDRAEKALLDAQTELVQSSKLAALGQMATGIVHELNQPISAMRTYAASGRLLLEREEPDKVRESFASVERLTDHMASITAQLKTFAYKAPKLRKPVVVQECLDGALAMTDPLLSEAEVSLRKQIPEEPVVISGDRGRIEQVLVNLIRNAVDAMRGASKRILRIQVLVQEQEAEIVFEDSGSGIEEKNLAELFNPFFTTKEVGKGLGLGLSISYRIVTDLGGTIHAANNHDRGASFVVRLPLLNQTKKTDKVKE